MENFDTHKRNVVPMMQTDSDADTSALAQVVAYWEALRGARLLPNRSEIDPRGIEQALEYCFIVERVAPGVARLRVAGSHLNALMGMEVRGMPLSAFFTPPFRHEMGDTLEEVFQKPARCDVVLQSEPTKYQTRQTARMVLLPLKSDLGDVSRCLGCIVAPTVIKNAPQRFEIKRKLLHPISAADAAPVDLYDAQITTTACSGFAEAKSAFGANGATKRTSFLRVVK
ncbi:MAG: PAS domain-containing protein [Sulfitobacter sp.]